LAAAVDSAVAVVALEAVVHPATGNSGPARRWWQHLTTTPWALRRCFPHSTLAAIDAACAASEQTHRAEIRCAVETALPLGHLWRGVSSTARAVEVFAQLHMWDTAENNGVLLYVLLAEHRIEIVADRGFAQYVSTADWRSICSEMEAAFGSGRYEAGALAALERITAIAREYFPARGGDRNELPNTTALL
jgi:uncharacterized membrane protein